MADLKKEIIKNFIVLFALIIGVVEYHKYRTKIKFLNIDYSITVAKVIRMVPSVYVYNKVDYIYFVNGKKFECRGSLKSSNPYKIINNYYEVKYSNKQPNLSENNLEKRILDTTKIKEVRIIN